ncbi:MAG TPA: calcium/sodium antiporter [Candidatus Lachnoclostridium pullistercoris]|uniref:Calcium/sodium antiporter n=1 Tax=Candidatus Lachnoclostridium pullistercoris TaxID=2838632 RepID=A0A9D2T6J9_9FIRM|nr:calcium/sodium antiporter [Candidatus Lachnoclostridium pullistercoris]
MATVYLWLIIGFVLLVKGADIFVEGSSSAAKLLRVPGVIIGMTVVAFGTSAPELAVSITAALTSNNGIALGNVIGSNMFNLLMVIGLSSIVAEIPADRKAMNGDFFYSIVVSVVALALIAFDRQIGRVDSVILLALFGYFIYRIFRSAAKERKAATEEKRALSPILSAVYIAGGLAAVVAGSSMVVKSASAIAEAFGFSENLIGLTVVALGTSLPELVTSMVAAGKGENGLALGNVIGSNIFNILLILGISSLLSPIPVTVSTVYDMICLILVSCLCWAMGRRRMRYTRAHGWILVALYAVYMVYVVVRS